MAGAEPDLGEWPPPPTAPKTGCSLEAAHTWQGKPGRQDAALEKKWAVGSVRVVADDATPRACQPMATGHFPAGANRTVVADGASLAVRLEHSDLLSPGSGVVADRAGPDCRRPMHKPPSGYPRMAPVAWRLFRGLGCLNDSLEVHPVTLAAGLLRRGGVEEFAGEATRK